MKTSFYIGPATRGTKQKCIGSIFWSGKWGEEPWKRDAYKTPSYLKKGYHRIDHYTARKEVHK